MGAAKAESAQSVEPEERARRLTRYTYGVSAAMILLCNAVFLLGLWGSGINLDGLIRTPDLFDPARDICLRLSWQKVTGAAEPVRLCQEWINLSDPSGDTHVFQRDVAVVQGADGKLYFDQPARVDYRLFLLGAFVVAVIAGGLKLKRHLIARYRLRLDGSEPRTSAMSP
ncbi:MAG: hypothetical protein FJ246_03850 [Nitrospira sp.]|nr:hypothetical protein [Nitrospira sp.]